MEFPCKYLIKRSKWLKHKHPHLLTVNVPTSTFRVTDATTRYEAEHFSLRKLKPHDNVKQFVEVVHVSPSRLQLSYKVPVRGSGRVAPVASPALAGCRRSDNDLRSRRRYARSS